MDTIVKIHKIVDENFDTEMDAWYYGPCNEILELSKSLTIKEWNKLIESTKIEKPDMWRVMISHSFIEQVVGLSETLMIFQACQCKTPIEAYLIIQYMDNFNWQNKPQWLLNMLIVKLDSMYKKCNENKKAYFGALKIQMRESNT